MRHRKKSPLNHLNILNDMCVLHYLSYCTRMQEESITRAIIVVQMGMTPSAKQVFNFFSNIG